MLIRFIILGAVQGLTEFLPVSSSGHLVIFQKLFSIAEGDVGFDIIVHLASLCALIIFFRKDIKAVFLNPVKDKSKAASTFKVLIFIILASFVTGVIGFTFKETFESLFTSLKGVAIGLALTAGVLFLTRFKIYNAVRLEDKLKIRDGLIVGLAQAIAIVPGISRSGLTISAAIFSGIERNLAVRLSFLLSIPAIAGAALLKIKHLNAQGIAFEFLFFAFISAFIFSFLSLKLLVNMVKNYKLHYFAYYCLLVSLIIFLLER